MRQLFFYFLDCFGTLCLAMTCFCVLCVILCDLCGKKISNHKEHKKIIQNQDNHKNQSSDNFWIASALRALK